jgi:O-antigen/teichoic acid export membrane protein
MEGLKEKAVKGVVWSGARIWGARAVSFVVFALLGRLLSPDAFGIVALASVYINFVYTFQDQGLGAAIVQREKLEPEHLDSAFWANILLGGLLTFFSFITAGLIAGLFDEPQMTQIIRWLSLCFILEGLSSVQAAILQRNLAFKELALREIIAISISGIIGVTLAFLGFGVWSLVVQQLMKLFVGIIVLWSVSNWRPRIYFSLQHAKDLFSFGLNIVGIRILNFLNLHSDELLIGYFLGSTLLGYYTVAYKMFSTMKDLLTSVTNAVAFPTFSRLQEDPEEMRHTFYQVVWYTSIISFPAFIGMSLIAPELIPTFFGPQWTLSIPVLQVLSFIGILHSIFYFHESLVYAVGKPGWRLGVILLNAITNVIAFAIAVRWGIVAVAAAYVIRGYLLSPVEFWMVHRLAQINLKTYFHQFLGPVLGSLAMSAAILGLRYVIGEAFNSVLQIATYVLFGAIIYGFGVQLVVPSLWTRLFKLLRLILPERFIPGMREP